MSVETKSNFKNVRNKNDELQQQNTNMQRRDWAEDTGETSAVDQNQVNKSKPTEVKEISGLDIPYAKSNK